MVRRLVYAVVTGISVLSGNGCGKSEPATPNVMTDGQHTHYHVHAADASHEHAHENGTALGGHAHAHTHEDAESEQLNDN